MTGPASPDPPPPVDLRAMKELQKRLRANRWEVHGDCCDDGDEAVPCGSLICAIEYEAEVALGMLIAEVERLRAAAPQRQESPTP